MADVLVVIRNVFYLDMECMKNINPQFKDISSVQLEFTFPLHFQRRKTAALPMQLGG